MPCNNHYKGLHKNVFLKLFKKYEKSCLRWESNQVPLTLRVGVLSLYQVFPGGYRLFCTAYNASYMFINPVVNS